MESFKALITSTHAQSAHENKLLVEEDNPKKKDLASHIIVSCVIHLKL